MCSGALPGCGMSVGRLQKTDAVEVTFTHDGPGSELQDSLSFENLMSELSTTFIRITADEIDREIARWLGRVALALDFDRSTIGQVNPEDGMLYTTHSWVRAGMTPVPTRLDVAKLLPWLNSKILADEVVAMRVRDAPAEAARDVEFARRLGNQSIVSVPLKIGGEITGAVTFGSVRSARVWSDRSVRRLRLISEAFGNALQRKRAVEEIKRFEDEMRQVSRIATMGELTVSLAHELNQPLGAILNNAHAARRMLSCEPLDVEEIGAALDDIVRDNSRAVDIIKHVRALFQRDQVPNTEVDLKALLLDVESLLRHEAMLKGSRSAWSCRIRCPT
jgi:signal transduction histidine kinase